MKLWDLYYWRHDLDDRRGGRDWYRDPELFMNEDSCIRERDSRNAELLRKKNEKAEREHQSKEDQRWTAHQSKCVRSREHNALVDAGLRDGPKVELPTENFESKPFVPATELGRWDDHWDYEAWDGILHEE